MLALSIRQPFAELILRGVKTVEYRSRPTRVIGRRFYLYASRKTEPVAAEQFAERAAKRIWSDDLAVTTRTGGRGGRGRHPPAWMLELAEDLILGKLPTGVIVGTAVIERVSQVGNLYCWHLTDVDRAKTLRKPKGHPQPVWFKPF